MSMYDDLGNAVVSLNTRLIATMAERARYRDALSLIRETEGRVCPEFTICTHESCRSSYTAWAIADEALGPRT